MEIKNPELREKLAALEHDRWSRWEKYRATVAGGMHSSGDETHEGRWLRQSTTPYADLTEAEKESDRAEADRTLTVLEAELADVKEKEEAVWKLLFTERREFMALGRRYHAQRIRAEKAEVEMKAHALAEHDAQVRAGEAEQESERLRAQLKQPHQTQAPAQF